MDTQLATVKRKTSLATIILVLSLAYTTYPARTSEQDTEPVPEISATSTTVEAVRRVDPPAVPVATSPLILKKISWCESKNRQFNADGSVKRGEINPQDVGKYQINEFYHLEDSKRLGFDIYTLEGNTGYANYLFETQGVKPWSWSQWCWGDPDRIWEERDGELWSK